MRTASRLPGIPVGLVLLLCAAVAFAAPPGKIAPRTNKNVPLSPVCRLPDLAVMSLTIELVSTTVGQPGVEFPADKLKITAVVKDNGAVKSPGPFEVRLFKNLGTQIAAKTLPAPTAAGQVWSFSHGETYVHDRPVAYLVRVVAGFDECDKANNEEAIQLNDAVLHKDGKQVATPPGVATSASLPGGIAVFF